MTNNRRIGAKPLFTKAELEQLMTYVGIRDREGWYYGRKDYFEKRHKSILAKLADLITGVEKL